MPGFRASLDSVLSPQLGREALPQARFSQAEGKFSHPAELGAGNLEEAACGPESTFGGLWSECI